MSWDEQDLEVHASWLSVAIEKGVILGTMNDFVWMARRSVPIAELQGTHAVVFAINEARRIKYRIIDSAGAHPNVLVQKLQIPKA